MSIEAKTLVAQTPQDLDKIVATYINGNPKDSELLRMEFSTAIASAGAVKKQTVMVAGKEVELMGSDVQMTFSVLMLVQHVEEPEVKQLERVEE